MSKNQPFHSQPKQTRFEHDVDLLARDARRDGIFGFSNITKHTNKQKVPNKRITNIPSNPLDIRHFRRELSSLERNRERLESVPRSRLKNGKMTSETKPRNTTNFTQYWSLDSATTPSNMQSYQNTYRYENCIMLSQTNPKK